MSESTAYPAPHTEVSREELDRLWATAAITNEFGILGNLPTENPNQADSVFFACLLRICSVIKGSGRQHYNPNTVLTAIQNVCTKYKFIPPKEIERQFRNAFNHAKPRFRQI